jgi:hypothetical protein
MTVRATLRKIGSVGSSVHETTTKLHNTLTQLCPMDLIRGLESLEMEPFGIEKTSRCVRRLSEERPRRRKPNDPRIQTELALLMSPDRKSAISVRQYTRDSEESVERGVKERRKETGCRVAPYLSQVTVPWRTQWRLDQQNSLSGWLAA